MFEARPITAATLRPAFAVMQLGEHCFDLGHFRKIVRAGKLTNRHGLKVGLFDPRGYIHALFTARLAPEPIAVATWGKLLAISDFTMSDVLASPTTLAMIEAIERWAGAQGFALVSIRDFAGANPSLPDREAGGPSQRA